MAQRFVRLLQERDVAALLPWLEEAKSCAWSQLRELARGLSRDLAAIQAALTLPYSTGPVEGQITRLKLGVSAGLWSRLGGLVAAALAGLRLTVAYGGPVGLPGLRSGDVGHWCWGKIGFHSS